MTEEQKAQRLAEWLAEPSGSPPPDGLDPDVVAAVYALRPDRAPSPRVSLDDIFAGVQEGPFATPAPTTAQVIGFPMPAKKRGPSRMWMLPTLGLGLAAAAATLLVFPVANELTGPDLVSSEADRMASAPMSTAASAPPEAPPEAPTAIPEASAPASEPAGTLVPDATLELADDPAPADGEVAVGAGPLAGLRQEKDGREGGAGGGAGMVARERVQDAPVERSPVALDSSTTPAMRANEPRPTPPPPATSAPSDANGRTSIAELAEEAPAAAGEESYFEEKAKVQTATRDDAEDDASLDKGIAAGKASSSTSSSRPKKEAAAESAPRRIPASSNAPAASKSDAYTPGSQGNVYTPAAPQAGAGQVFDYSDQWYRGYADVSAVYTAAAAKEAAGDWTGAAATYAPLLGDPRTDVAQDAAWRAGKALRNAGDATRALRVVQDGLRRSSSNTVFRSKLLALQGDLYAAAGKPVDADRAYDEAQELNEKR